MTTTSWTSAPTHTTDALFRAWGKGVSDAIAAVGFIRTADTGQINWTTVTMPTVANTQQGYEVYRFNDTLQATAPLFFRVGYGSGSVLSYPSIWLTVGKGSDGAGAITSTLVPLSQVGLSGSNATATASYASSGDGSLLALAMFVGGGSTTYSRLALIERSRSSVGAATGTGVVVLHYPSTTPITKTANYPSTYPYPPSFKWPVQMPTDSGSDNSLSNGGKAPVFAATVTDGLGNFWQPRSMLLGMRSDMGSLSTFTVPGWGTYMSCAPGLQFFDGQGGIYASPAIRWE